MLEKKYFKAGKRIIFGIDEAGRGPWAGPLVAGAVALPIANPDLPQLLRGVKDSKQMTARQRQAAVVAIKETALAWGIGIVHADEINEINQMTHATTLAMQRALEAACTTFNVTPDFLLIDYHLLPNYPLEQQESFKKGDSLSLSIAAASVLAKTWRDDFMVEMANDYPHYGFDAHKGYGTAKHRQALKQHGVTPIHRQHYAPIIQARQGTLE